MLKNFLLASVLGLCLFSVSFGQRDHDAPMTRQDMEEGQVSEPQESSVQTASLGKVVVTVIRAGAAILSPIVTAKPITNGESSKQKNTPPEPKTRPAPKQRVRDNRYD